MTKIELTRVRNLTSQTDIFMAGPEKCLDVTDLDQNSLWFHTPAQGAVGHQVQLAGTITLNKKTFKFEATGKLAVIDVIETGDTEAKKIQIHLHQFDKLLWKNLLLQIKDDRNRANKVFHSIRGEDE